MPVFVVGKQPVIVFSGSHDLALERVALHLQKHVTLLSMPVGSLDGLANLRQGLCQISGAHLLDESGEYNIPYVRHLFPDRDMKVVTLAHRTQGLMLANGNPKGSREIGDMARPNVRFVNRNPGSGTRLWFDGEMKRLQIPVERINGYESIVHTHSAPALLIASDKADYAPGETVTLTGTNWAAGEAGRVITNDTYGPSWRRDVTVTASDELHQP